MTSAGKSPKFDSVVFLFILDLDLETQKAPALTLNSWASQHTVAVTLTPLAGVT